MQYTALRSGISGLNSYTSISSFFAYPIYLFYLVHLSYLFYLFYLDQQVYLLGSPMCLSQLSVTNSRAVAEVMKPSHTTRSASNRGTATSLVGDYQLYHIMTS